MSDATPEVLYFGCLAQCGHHLRSRRGPDPQWNSTPWRGNIDGGILEKTRDQSNGRAVYDNKGGWSAVAFWDNSVDTRPGSHSTFLVREILAPEVVLELAKQQWPESLLALNSRWLLWAHEIIRPRRYFV